MNTLNISSNSPQVLKIKIPHLVKILKEKGMLHQNFSRYPAVALEPDPYGLEEASIVFTDLRSGVTVSDEKQ